MRGHGAFCEVAFGLVATPIRFWMVRVGIPAMGGSGGGTFWIGRFFMLIGVLDSMGLSIFSGALAFLVSSFSHCLKSPCS